MATSQKPRSVIDALVTTTSATTAMSTAACTRSRCARPDAYEGARTRIAKFITPPTRPRFLFTRGTTESINLVARSWGHAHLKPGDVVLTTEFEHHSNLVPWQQAAKASGATLKYVPLLGIDGEGGPDLARAGSLAHAAGETLRLHPHLEHARHDQSRR